MITKTSNIEMSQHLYVEETFRFETSNMSPDCYERVPGEVFLQELDNQAIVIENLRKTYPNGFSAVKGINLKLYSN